MPVISVVMGVYREKDEYLRQAVESILSQTYTDFEFIIVLDDPSNTEALAILEEYELKDKRICVLINESNMGLARSLNRGISVSKGKYIARMDADDISLETRFERQMEYFERHPDADIITTNKILIDEQGEVLGMGSKLPSDLKKIKRMLKYTNFIVHPSVMMKTEPIKEIGGYRNFPTSQDADLWLRAVDSGLIIDTLDEYLIRYRINSDGITQSKAFKQTLISQYIHQMQNERLKDGHDSFSEENLEFFLQSNGCYDNDKIKQFNKAQKEFREAQTALKNHKRIAAMGLLFHLFCTNKWMRRRVAKMSIAKIYLYL